MQFYIEYGRSKELSASTSITDHHRKGQGMIRFGIKDCRKMEDPWVCPTEGCTMVLMVLMVLTVLTVFMVFMVFMVVSTCR